jgi:hypothetical protein
MTTLPARHAGTVRRLRPPLSPDGARRLRPLIVPALLASAGLVIGGVPGFLLAFTAAVVAVDRALDFGGTRMLGAQDAFARAVRRRAGELEYLADDTGWAAMAPRRRLGVQTIAIDSIRGTSDRHKAAAFDRDFRPPEWSRDRWAQMYHAAAHGAEMPPISVYRVGDRHFMRDGHHRVSVARAMGAAAIEASVVELARSQPSERMASVAHSTAS